VTSRTADEGMPQGAVARSPARVGRVGSADQLAGRGELADLSASPAAMNQLAFAAGDPQLRGSL
jgi:hypothetical protein